MELGRYAVDELALGGGGLVRAARQGRAHLVAEVEVDRCLHAQIGRQRRAVELRCAVERSAKVSVGRLRVDGLEGVLHVRRKRRREESDLRLAQAVVRLDAGRKLRHLGAEGLGAERGNVGARSGRNEARPRAAVVPVDAAAADRHARTRQTRVHLFGGERRTRHAPVLAARAQRVAHLRGMRVEEADPALRDESLQNVVRLEREVHARRVGPDQDAVVREDEIHGVGQLVRRLVLGERRPARLRALAVDLGDPRHALHGVHPALRHEARRAQEQRADARNEVAIGVLCEYLVT